MKRRDCGRGERSRTPRRLEAAALSAAVELRNAAETSSTSIESRAASLLESLAKEKRDADDKLQAAIHAASWAGEGEDTALRTFWVAAPTTRPGVLELALVELCHAVNMVATMPSTAKLVAIGDTVRLIRYATNTTLDVFTAELAPEGAVQLVLSKAGREAIGLDRRQMKEAIVITTRALFAAEDE